MQSLLQLPIEIIEKSIKKLMNANISRIDSFGGQQEDIIANSHSLQAAVVAHLR